MNAGEVEQSIRSITALVRGLRDANRLSKADLWREGYEAGLSDGLLGYGPLADRPDTPNPYEEEPK